MTRVSVIIRLLPISILILAFTGCTVLGGNLDNRRDISSAPAANTQGKSATEAGMILDQELARKIIESARAKPDAAPFADVPDCSPDRKKVCSAVEGCKCVPITGAR